MQQPLTQLHKRIATECSLCGIPLPPRPSPETVDLRPSPEMTDPHPFLDELLWQAIIELQGCTLRTASGLFFDYSVRQKKNGEYSGEVLVSRKEESRSRIKSSILLTFHRGLGEMQPSEDGQDFIPLKYPGPKSIGQIFGISYIYSIFWKLGIIRVPEKIEKKLEGER